MFTEERFDAMCSELTEFVQGIDASCSGPAAVSWSRKMAKVHHLADAGTARLSKVIADTNVFVAYGDRTAQELCARIGGTSPGQARRVIEHANRLKTLPELDAAASTGSLSGQEAAMISAVAVLDPLLQAELIAAAGNGLTPLRTACVNARADREDPETRAERQHRNRTLTMWTNLDGMIEGRFELPPEVGGGFKIAVERQVQKIFRARHREGIHDPNHAYAADALMQLVVGEPGVAKPGVGVTVNVLIDHTALIRGNKLPGETCEIAGNGGPVNVAWVREVVGGEALLNVIIKKGRDVTTVAHLRRHIPAEIRTALLAGGHECCVEGCTRREYLEIDHSEIDYAKGGPTALWNLELLCSVDHKRKSQGWKFGPPDPVTGKRRLDPPRASRAA